MYLDGVTVKSVDMVLISEENDEIFDLNFAPMANKLLIFYSV